MKRLFALAAAALLLATPALAGLSYDQIPDKGKLAYVRQQDGTYLPFVVGAIPLGVQQVSVSSSAVGFTVPTGALWCVFKVETAAVRWRDDGTNPTASVGWPQEVGSTWVYPGSLTAIKFIAQASSGLVDIACYK